MPSHPLITLALVPASLLAAGAVYPVALFAYMRRLKRSPSIDGAAALAAIQLCIKEYTQ